MTSVPTSDANADHLTHLRHALSLAKLSPPRPTNFRVGALLVDPSSSSILATGYTLECPGNTHAEQCCFLKFAAEHGLPVEEGGERVREVLPEGGVWLYTTMEPCGRRASGNVSCVERIVGTRRKGRRRRRQGGSVEEEEKDQEGFEGGVVRVISGVREPETFVGENTGRSRLEAVGIECVYVQGLEKEILEVATAGHVKRGSTLPDAF